MILLLKRFLPKSCLMALSNFKYYFIDGYSIRSYSQEGEDMILRRIFERQKQVFMLMLVPIILSVFQIPISFTRKVGME